MFSLDGKYKNKSDSSLYAVRVQWNGCGLHSPDSLVLKKYCKNICVHIEIFLSIRAQFEISYESLILVAKWLFIFLTISEQNQGEYYWLHVYLFKFNKKILMD